MAKEKDNNRPLILIALAVVVVSVLLGIFTAVLGITNIQNYNHPYAFGFTLGIIGLILGIYISKKAKPYIAVNKKMKRDFWLPTTYISIGFIGISLWLGSMINHRLSRIEKCDNFTIVDKYRTESRHRSPEINTIVVNINGQSQRLICSYGYWKGVSIGQNIELCLYSSKLGFDFIKVIDDD